jgi:hypothetical protein
MRNKAVFWLALLATFFWFMRPAATFAAYGNVNPPALENSLQENLAARPTQTASHPVTPTPLPAIYKVEQVHSGMVIGAVVLMLIIVVGVLAFSRFRF